MVDFFTEARKRQIARLDGAKPPTALKAMALAKSKAYQDGADAEATLSPVHRPASKRVRSDARSPGIAAHRVVCGSAAAPTLAAEPGAKPPCRSRSRLSAGPI